MHGRIYQLSKNKITEKNYVSPEFFYDGYDEFADYIGDAILDKNDRHDDIAGFAKVFDKVFDLDGDTLIYKGIDNFIGEWTDDIKKKAGEIEDGKYDFVKFYGLKHTSDNTHADINARFYVEDWNDCAESAESLVSWCVNELKPGDRVYVGGIIDYHF